MKRYCISDPTFLTRQTILNHPIFQRHDIDYLCLRDKTTHDYTSLAKIFIKQPTTAKKILHTDYQLAHTLDADGIHLASNAFTSIQPAKALGLFTIVSTHSIEEAIKAQQLGADAITFSPIFDTPNKGAPKGLESLNEIVSIINIKVFALGGIVTDDHIKALEPVNPYGFASIRYFFN
jgi:thiamine-phosphate pyrophosphorylase